MINEIIEVRNYLDGKNICIKNLYRICFLLAKWYKEQGLPHVDIRKEIFDWGKRNNILIKYNVNSIIYKALDDKSRLKDNVVIKINNSDVSEITNRFDSKNTRLTALAILCYAKAYADRDKMFNMSTVALSAWINITNSNLGSRHIKELVDFGYITKVSTPNNTFTWDKKIIACEYRINVEIHNSGKYVLIDNDIIDLYSEIFSWLYKDTINMYQKNLSR